jgi:hypothetical protein
MSDAATSDPAARRREAGDFLRSRRERLTPSDVGLPSGFRRRTPGLRREEVAMLADVGTTWYTWLEQGRDDHPTAGRMLFEYSSFGVGDPPDMKLIVFTPLDDEGTVQKLDRLLRAAPF